MLYLGFIHNETNGDSRKYEFDNDELKIVINYIKNKDGDCLIPYNITEKYSNSFEKSVCSSDDDILRRLKPYFENSLERYKLFESRKLKIKKLLGT
jgi:hypothetical protein